MMVIMRKEKRLRKRMCTFGMQMCMPKVPWPQWSCTRVRIVDDVYLWHADVHSFLHIRIVALDNSMHLGMQPNSMQCFISFTRSRGLSGLKVFTNSSQNDLHFISSMCIDITNAKTKSIATTLLLAISLPSLSLSSLSVKISLNLQGSI
uniref:Uncharacterized protein n=1 Tax=Nelumbo nucifera TaxID=4432 RepID=A0A822YBN9_NELNU|nr:TPA_asm: hypothetical protein HUJ06_031001 [Nelumbo nucifera]